MSVLEVTGASVRIGAKAILDDADLRLAGGTVTIIVGPNGAGKSTLLSVAAGERRPDAGHVTVDGIDISTLGVRELARHRAVMPQDTTVAFPFTVREVVMMGRTAWRTTAAQDETLTVQALEMIGLSGFEDRVITTLSGGEHQLVAFARVIAQITPVDDTGIVLLDEPCAAMDIAHAESTMRSARDLASKGAAVGIVLHDLDAAAAYGDQLVLMDHGRVVHRGTVAEVCRADVLSEVYRSPIEVYDHDGQLRVAPMRVSAQPV